MVSKSERKQPFLVNLQEKTEKKGHSFGFHAHLRNPKRKCKKNEMEGWSSIKTPNYSEIL